MRRILAGSALVAALFTAAACGSDDGGDGNGDPTPDATGGGSMSTEEVCTAGEELIAQYAISAGGFLEVLGSGDQAAIDEAAASLAEAGSQVSVQGRELAAGAADPELATAIEAYATEFELFAAAVAADPDAWDEVDTTALDAASEDLGQLCG